MAEAGQFLEKGSHKLDICLKFIRKISNFGSKCAKSGRRSWKTIRLEIPKNIVPKIQ
jgi:hypothetical protein